MRKFLSVYWILLFLLMATSCFKETYRKDRRNKMTKKSRIANYFHSKQAVKITQDNLDKKEIKVKKGLKEREKQQREMVNKGDKSKGLSKPKHEGKFAFY